MLTHDSSFVRLFLEKNVWVEYSQKHLKNQYLFLYKCSDYVKSFHKATKLCILYDFWDGRL